MVFLLCGFLPEEDIGIVVPVNTNDFSSSILMAQFFDLYLNIPPKNWSSALLHSQKEQLNKITK